jgi:protein-arginine deiminase
MPKEHIVNSKDGLNSLWRISKHYNVSFPELKQKNPHLKIRIPAYWINIGDIILLPEKQPDNKKLVEHIGKCQDSKADPTPLIHMHIDANRDGVVDDDWTENNKWEPGKGKKGAVIFCNNDDEDRDKIVDNKNDKVDTTNDLPDLAPLILRKNPAGKNFPPGWKVKLEVASNEDKIRIFDKRTAAGKEIIGPTKGKTYEITDLSFDVHELAMEAATYPIKGFDGSITLKLSLMDDKGKVVHNEEAKVRVAPWIMFNHAYKTKKVYVVSTFDNNTFRKKLKNELPTGVTLQEVNTTTGDRWMQDAMEPGFASMPNNLAVDKWNVPATLRTANDRTAMGWGDIDEFPKNELLGPGYGFVEALPSTIGNSLDSFGNLECSPPFTHKVTKREYNFGRIIYGGGGREMHRKVRDFLTAQKVQKPMKINTDWLAVGHVDEVISFLPLPGNKFKVLLASTKVAMDIVKKAPGNAKLLQCINLTEGKNNLDLNTEYPYQDAARITGSSLFKEIQKKVQKKIDNIRDDLKKGLGLEDIDFIHLPVLFKKDSGRYIAYTAGVVNMLVVTKSSNGDVKLCIPKPFGPIDNGKCQFEEDIKKKLTAEGLGYPANFEFIDDFTTYHVLSGEIHCGTNSQRMPPNDHWWWEMEWI